MSEILLLSEVFPPQSGGSGRWFFESYRRIDAPCLFVVGEHEGAKKFDAEHDRLSIQRLKLNMAYRGIARGRSVRDYWNRFWLIRKIVRNRRCRQIHAARPLFEGLIARWISATTGVPFLCYVHGEDVSVAKTSRELTLLTNWVLGAAKAIIANSEFTKTLLQQDWDIEEERIHTINPGVDTRYFESAPRQLDVRNRLGWGERPVVLTVGRLQARKGQDVFIKALSEIKKTIPNVLYAVIGDGEEYSHLIRLTESLGLTDQVRFHREVTDEELLCCYQQCDLFCLPNRQIGADVEGFGMVLLEAQSCGIPVVAGMSGGTSETMLQGETGFIVDCTQSTALAALVTELLLEPKRRETMGREAYRFVRERFDWQVVANRSQELFATIE